MGTLEQINKKVKELNILLNPENAPDFLTASDCNELGLLSLKIGAVVNDFKRTEQKAKHAKDAMKHLDGIERDAKKILQMEQSKWKKWLAFSVILFIGYLVFV